MCMCLAVRWQLAGERKALELENTGSCAEGERQGGRKRGREGERLLWLVVKGRYVYNSLLCDWEEM
jgi:hypothetical protein